MLREIPLTFRFGWAWRNRLVAKWVDHPRWVWQLFRIAGADIAIVDGARPVSRRMRAGLQYLKAGQSG